MNGVWIVNTHSQLLAALRLRLSSREGEATLILTDRTPAFEALSERLREEKIFSKTAFVPVKARGADTWRDCGPRGIRDMISGEGKLFAEALAGTAPAEVFYYHNLDVASHLLYAALEKRGPAPRCLRFEEGLFSYRTPETVSRAFYAAVYLPRRLLGKGNLAERTEAFLCAVPGCYPGRLPARPLPPPPEGDRWPALLRRLYGLGEEKIVFPCRYLYFSGVFDFEGGRPIGELDLLCRLADRAGREDLLVKVHPRDDPRRFTDRGLRTAPRSEVPWEVLRECADLTDITLLTALSQSVLSGNGGEKGPRTVYLYRLLDLSGNPEAQSAAAHLERLLKENRDLLPRSLVLADSLQDVFGA